MLKNVTNLVSFWKSGNFWPISDDFAYFYLRPLSLVFSKNINCSLFQAKCSSWVLYWSLLIILPKEQSQKLISNAIAELIKTIRGRQHSSLGSTLAFGFRGHSSFPS